MQVIRKILIVFSAIIFCIISGCSDENPSTAPQPNLYKWEYVYGDSTQMLITTIDVSDTDIKMIWYSFDQFNVAGYKIQYTREQYYQDLGYVNVHGNIIDTVKYSYSTVFENPDSVNFRIRMMKFDGTWIYHQFIIIQL